MASPGGEPVHQILYADGTWLSLTDSGVYRSTDDGLTWQISFSLYPYSNGLTYQAANHTLWLLSKELGGHRSTDGGVTWQALPDIDFGNSYPGEVVVTDDFLFYRSYNRFFRLDPANPSLPTPVFQGGIASLIGSLYKITTRGNDLWITSNDSLLRSGDHGNSWTLVRQDTTIFTFDVHNDVLMLGTDTALLRSADYGVNWQTIPNVSARGLLTWSDGLWFADETADQQPLRCSADDGLTWQICSAALPIDARISSAKKKGDTILLLAEVVGGTDNIVRSGDQGTSWQIRNSGMKLDNWDTGSFNPQPYVVGDYLQVGNHFSADGGDSWFQVVLPSGLHFSNSLLISTIAYYNDAYFAMDYLGQLYRSASDLGHWVAVGSPFPGNTNQQLLTTDNHFYRMEVTFNGSGQTLVYETTDNGASWTPTGMLTNVDAPLLRLHDWLYYWDLSTGLFRSGNGGTSWQPVGAGLEGFLFGSGLGYVAKILAAGDLLFAYSTYGIAMSTDEGLTFHFINNQLLNEQGMPIGAEQLASDGIHVVAVANDSLYYSTAGSDHWAKINANLPYGNAYDPTLIFYNDYLYTSIYSDSLPVWRRAVDSINVVQVSGRVWRDDNNNGQQDTGELPYAGAIVQAGGAIFATSAADGTYQMFIDLLTDTLRVQVQVPISWVSANPPFYQITTSTSGLDFGLYFPPNITDLRVHQANVSVFRPGFDEQVYLNYENLGTAQADGVLRFVPASPLEFLAANPAPDATAGDTLIWNLIGLAPGSSGQIIIQLHTPATTPILSTVSTWAAITAGQPDTNLVNNEHLLRQIVVGSYDPNDKRSDHERISPAQLLAGEPIVYTVRFQNTGTFPADFVRITDTLDVEHLNVTTFRVLSSSHPCQTTLSGTGNVAFYFASIALPHSDLDEPASHGFVQYEVRAKPTLPLNTNITNTAFIYFDFNPPIITNTTETLVALPVPVGEPADIGWLHLSPNPANDYVEAWLDRREAGQLRITNTFGQAILRQPWSGETMRLELDGLAPGFYTVTWQSDRNGSRRVGKLMKQ